MKNIYLLLVISVLLLGCKNKPEPTSPVNNNSTSTTSTKDCYQVQSINGYGEVMNDHYDCMQFIGNKGDDFQSAYDNLESDFNGWKERLRYDYQNSEYWDAERIEIRTTPCAVRNTPDDKLEYKSVDFYMYNISPYKDYFIVTYYLVIDSKGNAYARQFPDD